MRKHNKKLEFFNPTGEPIVGIDDYGDLYCWRCFPLDENERLPEDFSLVIVYEEEEIEDCHCIVCGGAII